MDDLIPFLHSTFTRYGLTEDTAALAAALTGVCALLLLALLANIATKALIVGVARAVISRTRTEWDNSLLDAGVFHRLSHFAPALVVNALGPALLGETTSAFLVVDATVNLYLVVIALMLLDALLNAALNIAQRTGFATRVPVKGFAQAIKLVAILIGGIFILSILLGKTPVYFLSGLGALTAVLLLVFKDAILGFVAGIMISVNQLVRTGDWVEMPKAGADGFVIDVALTTVKVQNWDKTITTIPSYDLISGSFKNWSGMFESGGRRIKRAILIDMETVRFADETMLAHWQRIGLLRPYLAEKLAEVEAHNQTQAEDISVLANGRRLTNLGTFRAYCKAYLRSHPQVHQEMTLLVRQLSPTPQGLPLEIYLFTRDTRWAIHEDVQADIFDHLLAIIGEFHLSVYQQPAGRDLRRVADSWPLPPSPPSLPT